MSGVLEKVEQLEQAAKLHLKGYNYAEIGREIGVSTAVAKSYITEYKGWVRNRAEEDPDFLDRLAENTLQALDEMNLIAKEAWTAHAKATEYDMMPHVISSLKLIKEVAAEKSKLLQLAGARTDGGSMADLKRVEQVNEIVSGVLKDVVKECPRCRDMVKIKLAEAFSIMGKGEDAIEMEPIDEEVID